MTTERNFMAQNEWMATEKTVLVATKRER